MYVPDPADTTHEADVDGHHLEDHASRHDLGGADALTPLSTLRVERITSAQVIGTGSTTVVIYNSIIQEDDEAGAWTYSTSTGELTIDITGWYAVSVGVLWEGNATLRRLIQVELEGASQIGQEQLPPAASSFRQSCTAFIPAVATDVIRGSVHQNTGDDLDVLVSSISTMQVHRIR